MGWKWNRDTREPCCRGRCWCEIVGQLFQPHFVFCCLSNWTSRYLMTLFNLLTHLQRCWTGTWSLLLLLPSGEWWRCRVEPPYRCVLLYSNTKRPCLVSAHTFNVQNIPLTCTVNGQLPQKASHCTLARWGSHMIIPDHPWFAQKRPNIYHATNYLSSLRHDTWAWLNQHDRHTKRSRLCQKTPCIFKHGDNMRVWIRDGIGNLGHTRILSSTRKLEQGYRMRCIYLLYKIVLVLSAAKRRWGFIGAVFFCYFSVSTHIPPKAINLMFMYSSIP